MKRVFPGLLLSAGAGKGSVYGWRRLLSSGRHARVDAERTAILPAVNRTSAIRAFSALRQAWRQRNRDWRVGVGGAGDDNTLAMDGQSLRF
ncbi:hypothetical protein AB7A76_24115 [Klebsiella pneumoniae]